MHNRADEIVGRGCDYLGVTWRHQGRSIETGVDCIGLLVKIAHDLGLSAYDTVDYNRRPDIARFDRLMRETGCRRVGLAQMAHSDIIRLSEDGWPVHCGLYDARDRRWIIHATARARCVVREALTPQRDAEITSVWRFPGG